MLHILLLCFLSLQSSDSTLCYNGTLSFKLHGEDPLTSPPLFSSARQRARLRCALTVKCDALLCYNCSSTHKDGRECAGTFVTPHMHFNSSRLHLIKCDVENAMCFVRSWSARGVHAWIVQRGCYSAPPRDPFLQEMITPTRAMTCKQERLPDAEYKVCLCKADWCNSSLSVKYHSNRVLTPMLSSALLMVLRGILD